MYGGVGGINYKNIVTNFFHITICTVTCVFKNVISRNVTIKCDLKSLEDFYVYIRRKIFQ